MLNVTESAIDYIKKYISDNTDKVGEKPFRIYVEGGGCSGFQYGYTFDEKKEDDEVLTFDDVEILIDSMSLGFLDKCTLDYVSDFKGSGFVVQNPKATNKCGCGESFAV